MTLAKLHLGPNNGKRKLTTLELLLVAGFILFLAYMSLEPLVLTAGTVPQARAVGAVAAVPAAAPAAQKAPLEASASSTDTAPAAVEQNVSTPIGVAHATAGQNAATTPMVDGTRPVFVVTATSTVLERIAPIATVVIQEPATTSTSITTEVTAVPPSAASVVSAAPEQDRVEAAPAPGATRSAPVVSGTPKQASALRVEISDATGVDGLAKDVAQALEKSGMSIATVASVPAGKQRRTVILFRDGFEEEAKRLGMLFVNAPALVRTANEGVDVKLVLGSAAAREKSLLALDSVPKLTLGRIARSH